MNPSLTHDLVFGLPVLVTAALMVLLPSPLAVQARTSSSVVALALMLLAGVATVMLSSGGTGLARSDAVLASLAMLSAGLAAAPLLDRARPIGLVIAAPLAGLAIVSGSVFSHSFASAATLHTMVIAAVMVGLCGSVVLPLHPARHTDDGALRAPSFSAGIGFAGWALLALTLLAFAAALAPTMALFPAMIAAVAAALVALLFARPQDALRQAGQGLVAGTLIALLAPLALESAVILGLVAGFFVARSSAITLALRVDDPHGFAGSLLMPAMLGLLIPGLLDAHLLAVQIASLGLALAFGGSIAVILWPLTMLFFGVALPPPLLRTGLTAR